MSHTAVPGVTPLLSSTAYRYRQDTTSKFGRDSLLPAKVPLLLLTCPPQAATETTEMSQVLYLLLRHPGPITNSGRTGASRLCLLLRFIVVLPVLGAGLLRGWRDGEERVCMRMDHVERCESNGAGKGVAGAARGDEGGGV